MAKIKNNGHKPYPQRRNNMNKKIFSTLAVVVILAVVVTALVACNPYEGFAAIGGGDSQAASVSNGGYFVKQGNYAYFVNGYAGEATDGNEFGSAIKNAIVRADIVNGKIDNSTTKVVVPKNVYSTSSGSGFAIFGEWIYYATYNYDKDRNGTASTTDLDFMRTKIDASVTQKIATIENRTVQFKFTASRVVYYANNTLSYVDFSGMDTSKNIDNGKGTYSGTIAENVSSIAWQYDAEYTGAGIADYIFYTQTLIGDDSFYHYNKLYMVNANGGDSILLADGNTYLSAGEQISTSQQKVFTFTLAGIYLESDAQATIYYTKSIYKDETNTVVGLFCNKLDAQNGFVVANEKMLNSIANTTIFPLGYEKGAIAYNSRSEYCVYDGTNEPFKVTDSSKTIWYVKDGYAYYTASSSAANLYKISYTNAHSAVEEIIAENIKTDWLKLEFDGSDVYYFTSADNNYLHAINVDTFDKDAEDAASTMLGIYLDAEKPAEDEE